MTGGTHIMRKHLKDSHRIDPSASSVALKRQQDGHSIEAAILRGKENSLLKEVVRRNELMSIQIDKSTLEFLYITWTVTDNIPFHQVAHPAFRRFLEYINPMANQLLPAAGSTVQIHARRLFDEGKRRIRHMMLCALSDIHVTCDMWSSPNYLGLLGLVAHFTNEHTQLISITLALSEVKGLHSGENQARAVADILSDFQIRNKLGYFVMDNAHSNDTLIGHLAAGFKDEGIAYDHRQKRLRCNGHVINLAVRAFLFGQEVDDYEFPTGAYDRPSDTQLHQWRKLGPLGKLHNIIGWIMGSNQRIQAFKESSGGLMPHRDNGTRWNSWFDMLDWSLSKIRTAIITVTNNEPALSKDLLGAEEWVTLQHIRDFLHPFQQVTKATEGRRATLDQVLPSMDFLAETFENATEKYRDHPYMQPSIQAGYTKLLKYWNRTERSPAYIAAIVLNPTQKWAYFSHWERHWQPNMKSALQRFWELSYRSSTGLPERPITPLLREYTENQYHQWLAHRRGSKIEVADELERYIGEPIIPLSDEAAFAWSALEWWTRQEQRDRFPLLSRMAIDIFSIPAMSSEPERVFSGAKHTISEQRNRLKASTIEELECLKSWFRLGIFTEADLHDAGASSVEDDDI